MVRYPRKQNEHSSRLCSCSSWWGPWVRGMPLPGTLPVLKDTPPWVAPRGMWGPAGALVMTPPLYQSG